MGNRSKLKPKKISKKEEMTDNHKKNGYSKLLGIKGLSAKAKIFDILAGGKIAFLNTQEAMENDIYPAYRGVLKKGNKELVVMFDLTENLVKKGEIGLFAEVEKELKAKEGEQIIIKHLERPASIDYIRKKLDGKFLEDKEMNVIIKDLMDNRLSQVELAAFVSAMYIRGVNYEETVSLANSIVNSGDTLNLHKKPILDKHCVGGVAGNRTTMIVVPIIAAAGCYIPKSSSRAITSAAGTADTMEVLAPVDIQMDELKRIVLKTKGAIVWGGGMNLAAADDKLIKIRHPLSLDPKGVVLASVLSKKKAVNATHVIIDIPIGRGAKFQDMDVAKDLANDFINIGKKLGMKIEAVITDGSDPIGNGIGPALECKDVLEVLEGKGPYDLREKSCALAGGLLELAGKAPKGRGMAIAEDLINNEKALKKFREIIGEQGGNPRIKIDELPIGEYIYQVKAEKSGRIGHVDSKILSKIARAAGSPKDIGAGIVLHREAGDKVRKGEVILSVYSESETKIEFAIKALEALNPIELEQYLLKSVR
ncbi:AMP phosphorylase [Candidatus Micrarchaeota archaeon]|nr:AMP phosphorylase [Candidatus Micrarchaeota archaeon]